MASKRRVVVPADEHIANIVDTVLAATEAERRGGMAWYTVFAKNIRHQARACGLTDAQGIALFAALSPMAPIRQNWRNFVSVATTRGVDGVRGVFSAHKDKCLLILADAAHPEQYATGPKVSAFYRNLSGDESCVTVDRHAVSCCYNTMLNSVGSRYEYVEACYKAAAAIVGMSPAQCQAVAWVVWRRMKGIIDEEVA